MKSIYWYSRKYLFTGIFALMVWARLPERTWRWAFKLIPDDDFNPFLVPPDVGDLIRAEVCNIEISDDQRFQVAKRALRSPRNQQLLDSIKKMGSEQACFHFYTAKQRIYASYYDRRLRSSTKNVHLKGIFLEIEQDVMKYVNQTSSK
jgi:hypothetical protein